MLCLLENRKNNNSLYKRKLHEKGKTSELVARKLYLVFLQNELLFILWINVWHLHGKKAWFHCSWPVRNSRISFHGQQKFIFPNERIRYTTERNSIPCSHILWVPFSRYFCVRTKESFSLLGLFSQKKTMITKETNIPLYQYYSLNDYVTKENGRAVCNLFSLMFMTRTENNWVTSDLSRRLRAALSPASDVRPKRGRQPDPSPLGSDIISWPSITGSLALSFMETAVDSLRTHQSDTKRRIPTAQTSVCRNPFFWGLYRYFVHTHIYLFILHSFD